MQRLDEHDNFRNIGAMEYCAHSTRRYPKGNLPNYRPLFLLSHVRKAVDTAMMAAINEQLVPIDKNFCFKKGRAAVQALLQGEGNASAGMTHTAVLNL